MDKKKKTLLITAGIPAGWEEGIPTDEGEDKEYFHFGLGQKTGGGIRFKRTHHRHRTTVRSAGVSVSDSENRI